jgi:predicted amidohydrolase
VSVVRIAACAYPIERVPSVQAYCDKQERLRLIADAARDGAQLLVMPEYASMELGALVAAGAAGAADLQREITGVQPFLPALLDAYTQLARRHRVYVLGPSFPELGADGLARNRARLHAPSGVAVSVGKQQMTRFEREQWGVHASDAAPVIETELGVIGVAICYDSEFPLIVRRQIEAGAGLVLVPSCTDTLAGYHRVALSCRARALENQCYVAMAPTVGSAPWSQSIDENRGAAAVYGPVDVGFAADGVIAQGELDRAGWVHAALDFDALAAVRANGQVRNHRDWSQPRHLSGEVGRIRL